MKRVLITGGTGQVGSNLAHALLRTGCEVRILRRTSSPLTALGNADVIHHIGDVLDPASLQRAIAGCDTVFHTAAFISYWRRERETMMRVNVKGTANVVAACLELGVSRLVHTSSIAAIGYPAEARPAREDDEFNWEPYDIGYRISKHRSELEILKGVRQGLSAVMVNPSVIIGERDIHINGGRFVRDIVRGNFFACPPGGLNLVYVQDVVAGHLLAARFGRSGERYILGGDNLTYGDLMRLICEVTGRDIPLIPVPRWAVYASSALAERIGDWRDKRPVVSRELVAGIELNRWFSSEKAERELGYTRTPLRLAIKRTYDWYADAGLL